MMINQLTIMISQPAERTEVRTKGLILSRPQSSPTQTRP